MDINILPQVDVGYIDAILLDARGLPKVVPASVLHNLPYEHLQVWAHGKGVYQFITQELVEFLGPLVSGVPTIEVGAGWGTLGRALDLTLTDSHIQADPEVAARYAAMGQPTIKYPDDVIKMDALTAVGAYNPHTVVGCWLTQLYKDARDTEASVKGIDEEVLLEKVQRYIVVGNHKVHGTKRILQLPHEEFEFPWLVSRATAPELNRIYIWEK